MIYIFYLILAICFLTIALSFLSLAPWVPSRKKDLKRILKLAALKPGETFIDLGCGTGGVVTYISKKTPNQVIGVELAFPFFLICLIRKLLKKQNNLKIKFTSLYQVNLKKIAVVYLFAASRDHIKNKLKQKLKSELLPGSRVISYAFPIESWTPKCVDRPTSKDITIYLYTI